MLCLITGGSGSGKSEYAERMVMRLGKMPRLYIATMYPFDEECHERI
ncbi:MAG: bifunctional adenosylcobinamide kinase/adenosylcobinamide-phosphate guanylyltransferase, partial [Lachnospiraceae bacterium]|nr:bifunctional adenosylcobinamide kinase/adenosylcobinamide-phosphate guanylyltransferase [Lachnospiraceae bacterium]